MLMPTGLKGKERQKYVEANKGLFAQRKPKTIINKHPGLRVVNPDSGQKQKQDVEAKAHLEEKKSAAKSSR